MQVIASVEAQMVSYHEKVEIRLLPRMILAILGAVGIVVFGLFAMAQAWLLAIASAALGVFCLYRSFRGWHSVLRDGGEP